MLDVADPDGLVRSQAVQSGGLRVTLNGAEARFGLDPALVARMRAANVLYDEARAVL